MKDKSLTRVSVFLTSQIISLFGSAIGVLFYCLVYNTKNIINNGSCNIYSLYLICPEFFISMLFSGTWGINSTKNLNYNGGDYDYWYFGIDTKQFYL